jgi:hypothetical protein
MIRKAKAVWQGTGRDGSGHLSSGGFYWQAEVDDPCIGAPLKLWKRRPPTTSNAALT